ncbi:MAG: (Fe-S)-binding protein [Oscillochloris sp.]|nr:(Fe-S)-binding protein [Oscillochloris sp.]
MDPTMGRFVASLAAHMTPEDVVNLEACIDCKLCGEACAWYLGTGDEKLHPTYKTNFVRDIYRRYITLEGKIGGALGVVPTPTTADLREHMASFWQCTACGRCTLACPAGLSTRSLVRMARAAYTDSGLSQENPTLKAIITNLETVNHSFGLTIPHVLVRYTLFLCHQDIELPVDIEGAETLFVCPSAANTRIPDYATKVMELLNAANVDYTVSSRIAETGTEADHIVVHHELTKSILEAWENEAERLAVKQVMVAECGCDTRSMFFEAQEILGRPFKFPIVLFDAVLLDAINDGRLPIEKTDKQITLHDPCHSTRLAGQGDLMRDLLNTCTTNFIEMTPNREHNYCCNGGAGGLRLPENAPVRRQASVFKANQIKNSGADYVTTPCVVCMLTLDDVCKTYNLGKQAEGERAAIMMFEVVYEAVRAALARSGQLDRLRTPKQLRGRDETFMQSHSSSGKVVQFLQSPVAETILSWLENDEVVKRYFKAHPDAVTKLEEFKAVHARWAVEGNLIDLCPNIERRVPDVVRG